MTAEVEPVVVEVAVAAPVEVVWQSLRDPELIRQWHGWRYDGLDAEIDLIYHRDTQADEAAHTLQLGDGDRFELRGSTDGTVVRLVRAPYVEGSEWGDYYPEITEGWLTFLHQLKLLHEGNSGRPRRTIYLSGSGQPGAWSALVDSAPTRVGRVAYEAQYQRGVELPDLGPGLLIVGEKPTAPQHGGQPSAATAIVTSYGQDDDQFAAAVAEWVAWWRSGYPESEPPQV